MKQKRLIGLILLSCLIQATAAYADHENKRERTIPSMSFSDEVSTTPSITVTPPIIGSTTTTYQPATSTGRLLASNCFQCHGTNGTGGFERIAGGEASGIYKYVSKSSNTNIMSAHAQVYSSAQLSDLIGYLNQVR
jgi:cytochrome c553